MKVTAICQLIWLCVIITLSFYGHVLGQDSAKMTVHGLHTGDGSTITLCPNDTYLIYIECDVTGSFLQWQFERLGNPVLFSPDAVVGQEVLRSPINVTLTEKIPNNVNTEYKSLLKTFSDELRNALRTNRGMELSCLTSSNVQDTVSFVAPVEHKPSIDNTSLIKNELKVVWSTRTSDIVTIAVVIENIERGFQSTTFVEWNKREETILVGNEIKTCNATVIVYDRCRESYKSDVYTVQRDDFYKTSDNSPSILPSLSSNVTDKTPFPSSTECVSTPSVVLFSPTTPSPPQDCNKEEAIVVALSVLLILAISLVGILIFGIWWNKKKTSEGGFPHQGFELQEPKDKDNKN
jgi:hypothetical protein